MWDRVTTDDIDRAKTTLRARHDETIARHAEELAALDTDQVQVRNLERAVAAFVEKFLQSSDETTGQVVELRKSG